MLRTTPARPTPAATARPARTRAGLRVGAPLLLAVAFTALAGPAVAAPLPTGPLATAVAPSGPCTDGDGVTVVVDLTDLGGEVEVGCATGAGTGTEALQAAGFTDTRDASGMICAVDALPDPCPATFEGSFWSYWFAGEDGTWQTYMEGSDTAVPAAGGVEGWRYSDGSAGPTLSPADALALAPQAGDEATEDEATADQATEDEATEDAPADDETTVSEGSPVEGTDGLSPVLLGAAGVIAVLAVGAVLLRRRSDQHGPSGQD